LVDKGIADGLDADDKAATCDQVQGWWLIFVDG